MFSISRPITFKLFAHLVYITPTCIYKSDFLFDASSYHMVSHMTASMDASEPGEMQFLILGLNYLHIHWIVFREKK